jgi:DNA-binding NarL/FixJ family response regulator
VTEGRIGQNRLDDVMGEPDAQGKQTATILIAEDDASFASFIADVLVAAGLEAIVASDGARALELARERRPTAAVLDVNLPRLSGYEVCRGLRELYGESLPILFLSGVRMESYDRVAGLLIGADDYLVKPFAPDELLTRLSSLLRRAHAAEAPRPHDLTKRELEVLHLLAEGLEQGEIAKRLVISPNTVSTHIERILSKLGVRSRAQAVAVAYREALVPAI